MYIVYTLYCRCPSLITGKAVGVYIRHGGFEYFCFRISYFSAIAYILEKKYSFSYNNQQCHSLILLVRHYRGVYGVVYIMSINRLHQCGTFSKSVFNQLFLMN